MLTAAETERYARHLSLSEIGSAGQEQIKSLRVLCIGAGGIGSPALLYLAAMGVGHLGVIDHDTVELSNLQRQILFSEADIGLPKARVAKTKLAQMNSTIHIQAFEEKLTIENATRVIQPFDIVLDGSDNYETRYLVNDICCQLGKPLVSASIFGFTGQVSLFNDAGGPCYRCAFLSSPPKKLVPNCVEAGVLGIIPGILALFGVNEIVKWKLKLGDSLRGQLLFFDALTGKTKKYPIESRTHCPACVQKKITIEEAMTTCTRPNSITVHELIAKLKSSTPPVVIDVREAWEREQSAIPGSYHIPLGTIHRDLLPKTSGEIVCHCAAGVRSAQAIALLQQQGVTNLLNLEGGINAWNREGGNQLIK